MSQKYKLIGRNYEVSWNQPIVLGRRLTVYNVVSGVNFDGLQEYCSDHEIDVSVIREALNYCSTLECQQDKTGNFCDGCILNSLKNGWKINKGEFKEISVNKDKFVIHLQDDSVYMGSMEEYEEDSFGRMGWKIAESIKEKYNL